MDTNCVVESLDIFKDEPVSLMIVLDSEAVKPFPFDHRVEGFNAGIVVGIAFVAIAELELLSSIAIGL